MYNMHIYNWGMVQESSRIGPQFFYIVYKLYGPLKVKG
jgi:hypothetical protein